MDRSRPASGLLGLLLALLLLEVLVGCTSPEERRRTTVELADELLARGDRAAAVATLESYLDYDPRDVAVTVRLAALDLEADHAYQALQRLESLPSGGTKGDDFFEVLTRALVHAGQVERALPMLLARSGALDDTDSQRVDSKLVDVLVLRSVEQAGLLLADLPDPWRARRVEGLIRTGRLCAALEQRRLLGTRDDKPRLLELLIQAALARDELDLLQGAEEVHSGQPTPWKLLARHRLLLARGEEGEAAEVERHFLRAFPGHPRRYDVLMSLVRRENRSGRPAEALRLAEEATALRPSGVGPLMEKALALRGLSRTDEAESLLELVLALDPGHEAAKLLLRRSDERRREERDQRGTRVERLEFRLETSSDSDGS